MQRYRLFRDCAIMRAMTTDMTDDWLLVPGISRHNSSKTRKRIPWPELSQFRQFRLARLFFFATRDTLAQN